MVRLSDQTEWTVVSVSGGQSEKSVSGQTKWSDRAVAQSGQ